MAETALRAATYADLQALPETLVGEIIETVQLVQVQPFDAVLFPLNDLYPFCNPPSIEA